MRWLARRRKTFKNATRCKVNQIFIKMVISPFDNIPDKITDKTENKPFP